MAEPTHPNTEGQPAPSSHSDPVERCERLLNKVESIREALQSSRLSDERQALLVARVDAALAALHGAATEREKQTLVGDALRNYSRTMVRIFTTAQREDESARMRRRAREAVDWVAQSNPSLAQKLEAVFEDDDMLALFEVLDRGPGHPLAKQRGIKTTVEDALARFFQRLGLPTSKYRTGTKKR